MDPESLGDRWQSGLREAALAPAVHPEQRAAALAQGTTVSFLPFVS